MIDIQNLSFSYKGNSLYENLTVSFKRGHIYGLLGKNGSGKTTLLSLITGALFPKKGSLQTLESYPKNRDASMLSEIFYLPENFILPELSTKNYIKLYSFFYPNFRYEQFKEYCKIFEVKETKKLQSLSMGQQKKFLIAFGLACNCKLNLLDEPTNGLDIPSKSIFRRLITSCINEENTFIISTHQVKDIENIIDHVCIIEDGQLALDHSLDVINNAIYMGIEEGVDNTEIYSEPLALGQYSVVKENINQQHSPIDLELLFNASIANASKLDEVCSSYVKGENYER